MKSCSVVSFAGIATESISRNISHIDFATVSKNVNFYFRLNEYYSHSTELELKRECPLAIPQAKEARKKMILQKKCHFIH